MAFQFLIVTFVKGIVAINNITVVNSKEFAKRLEKILDHYGISATAFADQVDVNRSTISHLLSGRNKPSLDFVMKVVRQYPEVGLYWLLKGKGSFPTADKPEPADNDQNLEIKPNPETDHGSQSKRNLNKEIERIVIFYKDGSFKSYQG
jgi:transcriptional regulator with XRE-family HTH domain